ncbi:MAG: alpha/beta fold hydrolase [Planctomycetota bacterium]
MPDLDRKLPKWLEDKSRSVRLGPDVPALLCHPDWDSKAPVVLWMHGRTAYKELDPGRYSRWLRAGIAACSIDLPGHGERFDESFQGPRRSLETIDRARREVDQVLRSLFDEFGDHFDADRVAIGGMSLGGMVSLRRLCDDHFFRCAAVEGTTGRLAELYHPPMTNGSSDRAEPWPVDHDPAEIAVQDPSQNLDKFEPLPMLFLHSEADQMVPWTTQERFIGDLRGHFGDRADLIEVQTWPETGAPEEHIGFGKHANEAKTRQTEFFARHLLGD